MLVLHHQALNDPQGGKQILLALFTSNVTYCAPYPSNCVVGTAKAAEALDMFYGNGLVDIRAWKQGYPMMANGIYVCDSLPGCRVGAKRIM